MSWKELDGEAEQLAARLLPRIGRHDSQQVIALLFTNSWRFVVAYLAVLKLGHIAMPLDPSYKHLEVEAILKQIPPKLLIIDSEERELAGHPAAPVIVFEELTTSPAEAMVSGLRLPAREQIATLVFTSGTTGRPKAATYSHANHLWNIKVCSEIWEWTSEDTILISLPLSHWYGIVMGLSGAIYHGNTLYLQEWFDEEKTLTMLASGKISLFTHISVAYYKLLEQTGDYDLSNVRLCISGGSALPPAIWQAFKDRFGREILECYGSSETGRIASNMLDERIPGSPGRVLPGVRLRLGPEGEVQIKSPGVFPGYFHNRPATDAARTSDGWWRTGDIGELDGGRVILKGRVQERIRKQGYSISPRDVEWAMHQNPKIKEILVIGLQQPDQPSDRLVYFLKTSLTEKEVRDYCKQNLLYAWRPDKIIMLDAIPRTKNGKPKIAKLKEMAAADV